ncbi:serine-threonine protein kinase 19 [Lipomyces japonicus]|uniref:serine-threonine protein kinase 19 n=1 Tax=Lipomyces japonicus TaxID=56871 RepID=UPI0034CDE235
MISHLHALLPNDPTFVDQEIQRVVERGKVRRLMININAGDVVIDGGQYSKIINEAKELHSENTDIYDKFEKLLASRPAVTKVTFNDLADADILEEFGIRELINSGFLVLSGSPGTYLISVPNIGSFLKLAFSTRKWVVNSLQRNQWKESLEKLLQERYLANVKQRWRDFKGVGFQWIMMEVKGGGWCEPFGTPVGRGWKLTGKKE